MAKKIIEYLHLYIGQDCAFYAPGTTEEIPRNRVIKCLTPQVLCDYMAGISCWQAIKPILRPLIDLTEDEEEEIGLNRVYPHTEFHPIEFVYLLSKGIDLFGLIDAELAHDKTKLHT